MTKIDFDKLAKENESQHDLLLKREKEIRALYESNKYYLGLEGLNLSIIPFGRAGIEYGFYGVLPKEKCFFDNRRLIRIGPITYQSGDVQRSLYRCPNAI
jgi:hypothetical protein